MAPGHKKHDMPKFNICDRAKKNCYYIRWFDDEMKPHLISCNYVRRSKEEARKMMEDRRYELVMGWLEEKKGLVSVGNDPIKFIDCLSISTKNDNPNDDEKFL